MDKSQSEWEMYQCRACQWRGFDHEAVVDEVDDDGIETYLCPQCGGECSPMNDEEVAEWQHWQRLVSEAHGELIREWKEQPKPRGKRPTREEAERRLRWHITH